MKLCSLILISVLSKLSFLSSFLWIFIMIASGLVVLSLVFRCINFKDEDKNSSKFISIFERVLPITLIIFCMTFVIMQFSYGILLSKLSNYVSGEPSRGFAVLSILSFIFEIIFIYLLFYEKRLLKKIYLLIIHIGLVVTTCILVFSLVSINYWFENPDIALFNITTSKYDLSSTFHTFSTGLINTFVHILFGGVLMSVSAFTTLAAFSTMQKKMIDVDNSRNIVVTFIGVVSLLFVFMSGRAIMVDKAENQGVNFALTTSVLDNEEINNRNYERISNFRDNNPIAAYMFFYDANTYVPTINDFFYGNHSEKIISFEEKIERGKYAESIMHEYISEITKSGDSIFRNGIFDWNSNNGRDFYFNYFRYISYSSFDNPENVIPSSLITFYCFLLMSSISVLLFGIFLFLFLKMILKKTKVNKFSNIVAIFVFPLLFVAIISGFLLPEIIYSKWAVYELVSLKQVDVFFENDTMRSLLILLFIFIVFMLTICISSFLRMSNKFMVDRSILSNNNSDENKI